MATTTSTLKDRFKASIILAAVGDAVGFKNGKWEFLKSGKQIHSEYQKLGGISNIDTKNWRVSDDTVMHMATIAALLFKPVKSFHDLMTNMTKEYYKSMFDMEGRAPGMKCMESLSMLAKTPQMWNYLKYDKKGGGCGGSMRAMAIGMRYFNDFPMLLKCSIESGRITHTHVNGFMGAYVSALFTSYAIQQVPMNQWGYNLMQSLSQVRTYLKDEAKRDWDQIQFDMNKFEAQFGEYLKIRGLDQWPNNGPVFPQEYGIEEREKFYKYWSYDGWAGSSGNDSVIISYDAVLAAQNDYEKLVEHGVIHGGDNDSTGTISLAWYGAMYGMPDTSKYAKNWSNLEYYAELCAMADKLYDETTAAPAAVDQTETKE